MDAKEALKVLLDLGLGFASEQWGEVATNTENEVREAHAIILAALEAK